MNHNSSKFLKYSVRTSSLLPCSFVEPSYGSSTTNFFERKFMGATCKYYRAVTRLLPLGRIMRRASSGAASSKVKYSVRDKGAVLPENQTESLLLLLLPDGSQNFAPRGQSQRPRRVASRSWCAASAKPTTASTRRSMARGRHAPHQELLGRK